MFTAVPPRYDLVNHIITLGMDKGWRQAAVKACLKDNPAKILDLGCGTGDLSINLALAAQPKVKIFGLDYSDPMLDIARKKAEASGVADRVKFVNGEATNIPFSDGYFDSVGISFAFRNLTYKNQACLPHLAEVRRVLRSGGRYVIVESSQPFNPLLRAMSHFYMRYFVWPVGIMLSGNRGAYRYLAESASRYYSPGEVKDMLLSAGFLSVSYQPLFFGAAGVHVALR
jgi:demethylmenaquinone methyltransferase / 2-methoxy-6-polyprenyl-1,4-benzoquinol methylase